MDDEYWTKRDGTKVAVGDMDVDHLRNALRMIIRNKRKRAKRVLDHILDEGFGNGQDYLNAQARLDLANPAIFFPLLDGGVHGSPELQRKYGG